MVGILVSFLGWLIFRGELLVLGIIYTFCGLHLEQLDFLEAFGALQRASVRFSPISAPIGWPMRRDFGPMDGELLDHQKFQVPKIELLTYIAVWIRLTDTGNPHPKIAWRGTRGCVKGRCWSCHCFFGGYVLWFVVGSHCLLERLFVGCRIPASFKLLCVFFQWNMLVCHIYIYCMYIYIYIYIYYWYIYIYMYYI